MCLTLQEGSKTMEFVVSVQITIKLLQLCGSSLCTKYERRSTFFWSLLEFPSEEDMLTFLPPQNNQVIFFWTIVFWEERMLNFQKE